MAEKEKILKEKLDHSGVFDYKGFYNFAHLWFKNENYGVVEEKYSEKVSSNAKDIAIKWVATKTLSDYFKIEIEVKFDVTGLVDVEVEIDGKKKSSNKGKVVVEIKGTLIRDPESKWDESPFLRFLRDTYNKYVIPKRLEDMQFKVDGDVKTFKEELKAYLEMGGKRAPI
jgi:hypothetical protein